MAGIIKYLHGHVQLDGRECLVFDLYIARRWLHGAKRSKRIGSSGPVARRCWYAVHDKPVKWPTCLNGRHTRGDAFLYSSLLTYSKRFALVMIQV